MLMMGRSPHVMYRPSEISTTLDDVVGLGMVKDEIVKTLNLFLAYRTFREQMGGNPRRAILFEGPPGTGKTYMAKAMAREAGVPFLFVAASSIQSPYFGQTNRKIANFFKQLRKAARKEGGAIGFIEEIDAIAVARGGMGENPKPRHDDRTVHRTGLGEGFAGVINELLIQLQSFDEPTKREKLTGWAISKVNRMLPAALRDPQAATGVVQHPRDRRDEPCRRRSIPRCSDRAASTVRSTSTCPAGPAGARSSTTTSPRRRTCPSSTRRSGATSSRRSPSATRR